MNTTHGQNSQTKTETVRTMAGKPVATIRTNPSSGVQRGYDNLGNYAGKYDPGKNVTYDKQDRQVSKGNGLVGVATNSLCYKGMGVGISSALFPSPRRISGCPITDLTSTSAPDSRASADTRRPDWAWPKSPAGATSCLRPANGAFRTTRCYTTRW